MTSMTFSKYETITISEKRRGNRESTIQRQSKFGTRHRTKTNKTNNTVKPKRLEHRQKNKKQKQKQKQKTKTETKKGSKNHLYHLLYVFDLLQTPSGHPV